MTFEVGSFESGILTIQDDDDFFDDDSYFLNGEIIVDESDPQIAKNTFSIINEEDVVYSYTKYFVSNLTTNESGILYGIDNDFDFPIFATTIIINSGDLLEWNGEPGVIPDVNESIDMIDVEFGRVKYSDLQQSIDESCPEE